MQNQFRSKFKKAFLCLIAVMSSLSFLGLALATLHSTNPVQAQAEPGNEIVTQQRSLTQAYVTNDVELADVDGDGDLDMLLVNEVQPYLLIYLNNGGQYDEIMAWDPQDLVGRPTNAAWGDADGDGDLDLAVAVWGGNRPHFVYRNEGGRLLDKPDFITIIPHQRNLNWDAHAVAWGDLNGDGKLDLVFGHGRIDPAAEASAQIPRLTQANVIYQNTTATTGENPTLTFTAVWTSTSELPTKDIAIADVNGDSKLDIAVANGDLSSPPKPFTNTLYINAMTTTNEFAFEEVPIFADDSPTSGSASTSVAWANLLVEDGETQLPELVVGNMDSPSEVYCNRASVGEDPQLERCWQSGVLFDSPQDGNLRATHIAVADINLDGQLDIAFSGFNRSNFVLCGEGESALALRFCWDSTQFGLNLYSQRLNFGDVNGDGQLDLIEGNGGGANVEQPVYIYYNLRSVLPEQLLIDSEDDLGDISSAVLSDLDSDGDLDLIVGRSQHTDGVTDTIYFNEGGEFIHKEPLVLAGAENPMESRTQSVALANFDEGLYLAVGGGTRLVNQHHTPMATYVYALTGSEENKSITFTPVWSSTKAISVTTSVAWGDMNGDGYLDLAVGNIGDTLDSNGIFNGEYNQVFVYDPKAETFEAKAAWQSLEPRQTYELAWGDVDNDGDLDLAVANFGQPNELFINEGGKLSQESEWVPNGRYYSTDLAWVDINGDDLLDLVIANGIQNSLQRSFLYLNKGGTFAADPDWASQPIPSGSVAVIDVDNDGDDDVAFSTFSVQGNNTLNLLYLNEGGLLNDTPIKWGVMTAGRSASGSITGDLLVGDIDQDGDSDLLDLFRGSFPIENRLVRNTRFSAQSGKTISILQPETANFQATADTRPSKIDIPFILQSDDKNQQLDITALYSLNGRRWQPLQNVTFSSSLPLVPSDVAYTLTIDFLENNFLGRFDNFTLRLVAIPHVGNVGGQTYENDTPGPFLFGSPAATSYSISARGRDIEVQYQDEAAENAIVFRQTEENDQFSPYVDGTGFSRTASNGLLQESDVLGLNDRLFALWPVAIGDPTVPHNLVALIGSQSENSVIDLYYTSHPPTATGVVSAAVDEEQLQTLAVSQANKLYLFNLDVSLEWDASYEPGYLAQLQQDINRASAILYDLTDGQMALGEVNIYMDKERWRESHIQIHTSNRYRPNADFGGIVSRPMSLTLGAPASGMPLSNTLVLPNAISSTIYATGTITNAIWPGQVRMPALWNRFGEPGFEGGEDWARTLAHELGHYLLFLPDNYLLAKADTDYLLEVDNNNPCVPSAMTTAYANTTEQNSEFLPSLDGQPCSDVIAASLTGLADWEVISNVYGIQSQSSTTENGPRRLPLTVTQVKLNPPEAVTLAPIDTFFFVDKGDGTTEALSPRTVASYLIRSGELITEVIPLGAPIGNQIWARGAKVGDELCVYDSPASTENQQSRAGCGFVLADGVSLAFTDMAWTPIVSVSPPDVASDAALARPFPTTLTITIGISSTNSTETVSAENVSIQLFTNLISQTVSYSSTEIELTPTGIQNQFNTTVALDDIPVDGYVRVWINGRKEAQVLIPFFLGGGWLPDHWASGPDHWASGPDHWASGPDHWASGVGFRSGWNAPVSTGDGQLTIFNICSAFDKTPAYQLQTLPTVPHLPPWLVPIGSAYRLTLDDEHEFGTCPMNSDQKVVTSLLFSYLERDLPNRVYEDNLQVYYLADSEWKPLPNTTHNTTQNLISGGYLSNTVYVLGMATQITLTQGWNLIGYPLRQPHLIADMIEPINEDIALIYSYSDGILQAYCSEDVIHSGERPRQNIPATVRLICSRQVDSDGLTHFEFGHGYWILATNATTLLLPVDLIGEELTPYITDPETTELPAIIHGTMVFPEDMGHWSNAKLVAWMDDKPCGEAAIQENSGQYTYQLVINQQDLETHEPCGRLNQPVSFTLNGTPLTQTTTWDNRTVQEVQLTGPKPSPTVSTPILILVITVVVIVGGLLIQRLIRQNLLE